MEGSCHYQRPEKLIYSHNIKAYMDDRTKDTRILGLLHGLAI